MYHFATFGAKCDSCAIAPPTFGILTRSVLNSFTDVYRRCLTHCPRIFAFHAWMYHSATFGAKCDSCAFAPPTFGILTRSILNSFTDIYRRCLIPLQTSQLAVHHGSSILRFQCVFYTLSYPALS